MSDEVDVLQQLLKNGSLDQLDTKVKGIALLAVDRGYDHLTNLQQVVLRPHLTQNCSGVTNPGGHHNHCNVVLEGKDLAAALEHEGYYGRILCEDCVNETGQYQREWERIDAE